MLKNNPSLIIRISIGKITGFIFGLLGFIFLPYFLSNADWMLRWGILLWYTTFGGIIGMVSIFDYHPILKIPLPWWLSASIIGAWMNFVLTLFTFDLMQDIMLSIFGENGILSSPFWFIVEGGAIGLIIGYLATKFTGKEDMPVG